MRHGGIGEVVNTADCDSVMHRFESDIPPHSEIKSLIFNDFLFS